MKLLMSLGSLLALTSLISLSGCAASNAQGEAAKPPASTPASAPAPDGNAQASGAPAASAPAKAPDAAPPRPADADADVAYYRQNIGVLERTENVDALDLWRLRRGRMYSKPASIPLELQEQLGQAFEAQDVKAVEATAGKILSIDATDVRARMFLAFTLKKAGRVAEAKPHSAIGVSLLGSILKSGDGHGFATAWRVFQVAEEYEALKALGFVVQSQSLQHDSGRAYDVLSATNPKTGQQANAYFDVTELLAEQGRVLAGQ